MQNHLLWEIFILIVGSNHFEEKANILQVETIF